MRVCQFRHSCATNNIIYFFSKKSIPKMKKEQHELNELKGMLKRFVQKEVIA